MSGAPVRPGSPRRVVVSRLDVAHHSGQKAPADVRQMAGHLGFAAVDLAPFTRSSRTGRAVNISRAGLQALVAAPTLARSQVLLSQHPLGRVNDVVLDHVARRTRSVVLVHDLESLRRIEYARREQKTLSSYGVVIVHTPAMADYLREVLPDTRSVVLGCFDYLVTDPAPLPTLSPRPEALYVIGSLGPDKAAYLYELGGLALPVRAYGRGCLTEQLPVSVTWSGVLDMHRPQLPARDGFGVVWDGTSPDRLAGQMGTYLRYNSPHKFSMYLALGLPVVVAAGSALSELVETEGIGLVAGSLADAACDAAACSPVRWQQLAEQVQRLRQQILNGDHVRTALRQALALLEQ